MSLSEEETAPVVLVEPPKTQNRMTSRTNNSRTAPTSPTAPTAPPPTAVIVIKEKRPEEIKPPYPSSPLPLVFRTVGDKEWSEVERAKTARGERDRIKIELAMTDIGKSYCATLDWYYYFYY